MKIDWDEILIIFAFVLVGIGLIIGIITLILDWSLILHLFQ